MVITGNLSFYKCLSQYTYPLGRLGNKNAFEKNPENL